MHTTEFQHLVKCSQKYYTWRDCKEQANKDKKYKKNFDNPEIEFLKTFKQEEILREGSKLKKICRCFIWPTFPLSNKSSLLGFFNKVIILIIVPARLTPHNQYPTETRNAKVRHGEKTVNVCLGVPLLIVTMRSDGTSVSSNICSFLFPDYLISSTQ